MDTDSMMAASIQNFYKTEIGKEQQIKLNVTKEHNAEMLRCYNNFERFILQEGCSTLQLFPQQVEMIPGPSLSGKKVPRVLVDLGPPKSLNKVRLCNIILCQWARQLKNTKDASQHLQPSTHTRKIRTLLGYMEKEFGWCYSIAADFNGPGELQAVINNLFEERKEESIQNPEMNPYGTGMNKQVVSNVTSVADLDWTVFDENDPTQFQMKIMSIFGALFGLRGRKEHAQLTLNNLTYGEFEAGHAFEGFKYYGIQGLYDKSCKLTIFNQTARETNITRIPVIDEEDPADAGGSIHRFLEKISPGQQRLYCYEASMEERAKWVHAYPNACYSPGRPLGENVVARRLKSATRMLGLGDVGGHGLRRLFGTTLHNADGVSIEQTLESMRHGSVGTSRTYAETNIVSDGNKLLALGFDPKKGKKKQG